MELRYQVIDLEASLAEEWLSPELMSALRSENMRGDLTEQRSEIESFEEWHKSDTAKLFAPPMVRNEKKASGYFFNFVILRILRIFAAE